MIIDGKTIEVGTTIKFRTINSYDTNLWTGTIVAIGNYDVAKMYTDVVAYHQNVLKDTPELDPANTLTYLIIKTTEDIVRAFAVDWIEVTTLVIVDTSNNINIIVYNVDSGEVDTILTLLRDNNYNAAEVS